MLSAYFHYFLISSYSHAINMSLIISTILQLKKVNHSSSSTISWQFLVSTCLPELIDQALCCFFSTWSISLLFICTKTKSNKTVMEPLLDITTLISDNLQPKGRKYKNNTWNIVCLAGKESIEIIHGTLSVQQARKVLISSNKTAAVNSP